MIVGLRLPYLSEPDPELAGEGSIDPLGTALLADRLADQIAPGITARMFRLRFVTAIAVASVVTEALEDVMPADGVTPPYLAFEWILAEALAKARRLPPSATLRVPGIEKARSALSRGEHLDALSYLKVPKVFGYHGVYKRLARAIEVVDSDLLITGRGERLVRTWEREQKLPGFVDRERSTPGGSLARRLEGAVEKTLKKGRVDVPANAWLWIELAQALRLDHAGPGERRLLKQWLLEVIEPMRREMIFGVQRHGKESDATESSVLRAMRPNASPELAARLDAIDAYEGFAELITVAFDTIRRVSTAQGTKPVKAADLSGHPLLKRVLDGLRPAFLEAAARMEAVALGYEFEEAFGRFGEIRRVEQLVDEVLTFHEEVQRKKPPAGKRPWLEVGPGGGHVVRIQYRLDQEPEITGEYLHPFRVRAIQSFLADLR